MIVLEGYNKWAAILARGQGAGAHNLGPEKPTELICSILGKYLEIMHTLFCGCDQSYDGAKTAYNGHAVSLFVNRRVGSDKETTPRLEAKGLFPRWAMGNWVTGQVPRKVHFIIEQLLVVAFGTLINKTPRAKVVSTTCHQTNPLPSSPLNMCHSNQNSVLAQNAGCRKNSSCLRSSGFGVSAHSHKPFLPQKQVSGFLHPAGRWQLALHRLNPWAGLCYLAQ